VQYRYAAFTTSGRARILASTMTPVDRRALKILLDTHWSPGGWKPEPRSTPPADLEYAVAAGYMFSPREIEHDGLIASIERLVARCEPRAVGRAFLASLSSRRLDLRSALGSYAVGRHMPRHASETPVRQHPREGTGPCRICGSYAREARLEDVNVFSFERFKWGGVRHLSPEYIAFDLEQLLREPPPEPTDDDRKILAAVIGTATRLQNGAGPRDLEKALADVVRSNKAEREMLIQTLAYCGVLDCPDHPGFFARFVPHAQRPTPPASKIDWRYPACWWRARGRVGDEAFKFYFGDR
jgi:hypothetical protein